MCYHRDCCETAYRPPRDGQRVLIYVWRICAVIASDGWFLLLARLPRMQNISVPTITEQAAVLPPQEQAPQQEQASQQEQPLDLTSLALTSQPMTPGLLEAILKAFPTLKELSVTWPEKGKEFHQYRQASGPSSVKFSINMDSHFARSCSSASGHPEAC